MRIFLALVLLVSATFANASSDSMSIFANKMSGSFDGNYMPAGYTSQEIKFVKWSPALVTQLVKMEEESTKKWIDYVETSGELDYLTEEEKEKAISNPPSFFDDKYLTQIRAQYEVYQNGKLIGYVVDIIDHVMSTIYQDGAGTVIYLDTDLNIVYIDEWAA